MNLLRISATASVLAASLLASQGARANHAIENEIVRVSSQYFADSRSLMVEARLQFRGMPELDSFLRCLTASGETALELQRAAARRRAPHELALLLERLDAQHHDLRHHLDELAFHARRFRRHECDLDKAEILFGAMGRKLAYVHDAVADLMPRPHLHHGHPHGHGRHEQAYGYEFSRRGPAPREVFAAPRDPRELRVPAPRTPVLGSRLLRSLLSP